METLSETEFAPSTKEDSFIPNAFVDISKFFEKKIEIMKIFESEMAEHPFPRSARNLKALAILMQTIEEEENKNIREPLKLGFSSMVHLCSKMTPISKAGHFTPFSSAWIQHSYWYPSGPHMEQNVWQKFESAIKGPQGIIRAKAESNDYFKKIKIAPNLKKFLEDKYDIDAWIDLCFSKMVTDGWFWFPEYNLEGKVVTRRRDVPTYCNKHHIHNIELRDGTVCCPACKRGKKF